MPALCKLARTGQIIFLLSNFVGALKNCGMATHLPPEAHLPHGQVQSPSEIPLENPKWTPEHLASPLQLVPAFWNRQRSPVVGLHTGGGGGGGSLPTARQDPW